MIGKDGLQDLKVDGRHLRCENGPLLVFHALGKLRTRELGAGRLALHVQLACGRAAADLEVVVDRFLQGVVVHHVAAIALLLERSEERAQADARSAKVAHLVDLEAGVDLAACLQDLLDLVCCESVQAAAKAVELDHIQVVALGDDFCRTVEARMVHPLVINAQVALHAAQMRNRVLCEHGKPVACDELGDGMVDLAVVVIRAARQDDAVAARLLKPRQDLLAFGAHCSLEALINTPGNLDSIVYLLFRGKQIACHIHTACGELLATFDVELLVQTQLERLFVVVRQKRVEEVYIARTQLVDVELERLAVAHDDGAVVVVVGSIVLAALPACARHPDEVDVASKQVHDVAVGQLCRIAHAL